MKFIKLGIEGSYQIEPEPLQDKRGYFSRWYDTNEFILRGLKPTEIQGAVSHNTHKGTLRGLHYIPEADGEEKLVRCIRGHAFDVIVDLRPRSRTFRKWIGLELSAQSYTALYIPRGCAHGFITLDDNVDITYQFSMSFRPNIERGVRWNDPDIGIIWPLVPIVISSRDEHLPFLRELKLS